GAEKEVAAMAQREMEKRNDAALERALEIDEQIAARNQVELRERSVLDEVVHREDAHIADVLDDAVGVAVLDEETLEPLGRHVARSRPNSGRAAPARAPGRRCRWRKSARAA